MSGKGRQPVRKGAAKVPVVMQLEALECGAACLCMVLAYYGKWVPLEQVREDCGVSRDGSNALSVLKAARSYGLEGSGYRYETEELRKEGVFPCIIHWEFNHFVVLDGFRGGKAYLNDPARGNISVPIEEFDRAFTGITLCLTPSDSFVPSGKRPGMTDFARKRLKGAGPAIVFTLVTAALAALIGAISPAFSRVFLDHLLSGRNREWMTLFLLLLGGFDLIRVVLSGVSAVRSMRINGKMAVVGSATFMWKILRLPVRFFDQRSAADLQNRQESNGAVATELIGTLAPLMLNAAMMIVYLVLMLRLSSVVTLIGVGSMTINLFVSRIISGKRINLGRVSVRESAKLASSTVSGISMIETIKASGAEDGFFRQWSGYQAAVNACRMASVRLEHTLGLVPQLIATLSNQLVLVLGVLLILRGKFTIGTVMAFQSFLTSFMSPASELLSAGQTIQEMTTRMERINDVMEYPEDRPFGEDGITEGQGKLSGEVELKHVSFGYVPFREPLIRDLSLKVERGKSIAIVGRSGCGKSTLSRLISGLYSPAEGQILFDGRPMSAIPREVFRSSVAVVDQEIVLFGDTIGSNIRLWDETIEDFEVILAARDAAIHDEIMQRPDGYRTRLTEGGRDLSGGQRQRIEIARVLAQDPTLVILDEATSALDAKTEFQVTQAIRDRGLTCIVIAHRLSAIRSCDEIILLENGRIADRGTHRELMERSELYRELVSAE